MTNNKKQTIKFLVGFIGLVRVYDKIYDLVFNKNYPYKEHLRGDIWQLDFNGNKVLIKEYLPTDDCDGEAEIYLPNSINSLQRINVNKKLLTKLENDDKQGKIPIIKQKNKEQLSLFNIRRL